MRSHNETDCKEQALISVVVPIYNSASYLKNCVNSILQQSYKNLEIILVDDGSDDESGNICDDYAKDDDRIVVIHKMQGGLSSARNAGIEIAQGEFIGFIDSDDWIHEEYFSWLAKAIGSYDIAVCKEENVVEGEQEHSHIKEMGKVQTYTSLRALKNRLISTFAHGRIYRNKCFSKVRYLENVKREEDILCNHEVIPKCNGVQYIDVPLYFRRIRKESMVRTNNADLGLQPLYEFVRLAEMEGSYILVRRAYRSILSYRQKNALERESKYFKQTQELVERINRLSGKIPLPERLIYKSLIRYPDLFQVMSRIRKTIRGIKNHVG